MSLPKAFDPELRVISRSGFLTKELWREFLFTGKSRGGAHNGWARLLKTPYSTEHSNPHVGNVLVFNRRSRAGLQRIGGTAASAPYEAFLRHDETLLRGVLKIESHGFLRDWILEAGLKSGNHSEYQIRSQGKEIKYPDAVLDFRVESEFKRVAVELELTQKDAKRYEKIISSYSFMRGVSLIIFVTASAAIEAAIKKSIKKSFYPAHRQRVAFMRLDGWNDDPLLADIEVNGKKMSLGSWVTKDEESCHLRTTSSMTHR